MLRALSLLTLWVLAIGGDVFAASKVRALLAENRIDDAVSACRELQSFGTNDNDNLAACAWAYYRGNRLEAADKIVETLRRNPGSSELLLLQAFAKIQRKQFAEARRTITQLANENRSGAFAVSVQEVSAELYEAQGQSDTAAFVYKQIAIDDPGRGRAHWGLGRYYLGKGDLPRARTHLEQTAKLWPKHLGSRYNLAVLALNENNFSEGARWLADCYRLDRADPGVLEQMGVLFEKKGKIAEAIKYWKRALGVRKDSPLAREKVAAYSGQYARELAKEKKYPEALEALESGSPKDAKKRLKRGILYRNLGRYDKAIGDLLSYSKIHPKDPVAHRELGICYLNNRSLKMAGSSFARAITLEPDNGINYAWLGFLLEAKGKYLEARESWKKAIDLMTEPRELEKATRRLAAVEEKLKEQKKLRKQKEDDGEDSHDIEREMENMDVFEGVDGIE